MKTSWPTTLMSTLVALVSGCTSAPKTSHETWYGENGSRIIALLQTAPTPERRLAIFDWDNTVIKNDVGDALFFWMLAHDRILRPNGWATSSRWLNPTAVAALEKECKGTPGKPLATSTHAACADALLSIYVDGKIPSGAKAWKESFNSDTFEPAYGWLASLLAGYDREQVKRMAADAIRFNLDNPIGATQKVGSRKVTAYVRIYSQMRALIADLQSHGFDVWIVSASPQPVVEVFAERVNVAPAKVIGIRNTVANDGKYTDVFEGCGLYSEGNQEIITYRAGKRCWINKSIVGVTDGRKMLSQRSPITLAAGDSDTDFFFMKDTDGLRIAINRNKPELMCHTYANKDGKWLANPMFIAPKSKKPDPYACARFGLPDQEDKVFGFHE